MDKYYKLIKVEDNRFYLIYIPDGSRMKCQVIGNGQIYLDTLYSSSTKVNEYELISAKGYMQAI